MLAIKLQRIGKRHQPSYRLVVAEKRSKMAGPPVEDLGAYNPRTKEATFKKDRAEYWLGVGAQPTVTAHNLLVTHGIVSAAKRAVKMKKVEAAPVAETAPEAPAEIAAAETAAAPAEEAAPATEEAKVKEAPAEEKTKEDADGAPAGEAQPDQATEG